MNAKPIPSPMTDADLDRALASGSDTLLPSSGFADCVMTAVFHEASAPAPIPFPWKRALPGLAGILAAAVLLVAAMVSVARSFSASALAAPVVSADWHTWIVAHHASGPLWIAVSLAIPFVCLFLCRRLIASR